MLLITALLGLLFAALLDGFASWGNALTLLRNVTILGVFALGMLIVIIGRGIDLSQVVIAMVSVAVAVKLMTVGIPEMPALLAGFVLALALGLFNGIVIGLLGVPALFATLASGFLFIGLARASLLESMILHVPAADYRFLILGGNVAGIPVVLLVLLLCIIAVHVFLAYTRPGQLIYAHGDNPAAAWLIGVPVRYLTCVEYSLSAVLGYIAGLLMVASTAMVDLKAGHSIIVFEIVMIAVLGGARLAGGRGSVISVIAGMLLIGVLVNGLTLMNLEYQWQNIIKGSVLLLTVVVDSRLQFQNEEIARQGL